MTSPEKLATPETVRKALQRAYSLGQTYWQQADSESFSQNRKADETAAKFQALVEEAVACVLATQRQGEGEKDDKPGISAKVEARKPTGFVATCQCGKDVGALDYDRSPREDVARLLGRWLAHGCTVTPKFAGTWSAQIEQCECLAATTSKD